MPPTGRIGIRFEFNQRATGTNHMVSCDTDSVDNSFIRHI